MCNCLDKMESEFKKRLISERETKGQKIHEFIDESESGFQCKGLMFSSGKWEFVLPVEYKYIILKSDGTPEKRISRYKSNLIPSYCPVCGKENKK